MYCRYDDSNSKLENVVEYSKLGWHLFPVHSLENGTCTCGDDKCTSVAKHPLTDNGVKAATADANELTKFFSGDYSIANVGLATGEPSGVFVLDVDDPQSLDKLTNKHGALPATWKVQTGSGGTHYYFRWNDSLKPLKNAVKFAGSLDIRTTGGYVLIPPSIHACGNNYCWLVSPYDCELAEAPEWLLDLIPKHGETIKIERATTEQERLALYLENTPAAISGSGGHAHTFATCCRIVELFGGLSDQQLFDALENWNDKNIPLWTAAELQHKLKDARKKIGYGGIQRGVAGLNVHVDGPAAEYDENESVEWPTLDATALHGIAGDIVRAIEPTTEADSVALLLTLLTAFGNAVGRKPYFNCDGSIHHANIYGALVGDSSRARKGTSLNRIIDVLREATPPRVSGLSSGEGLIAAVGDGEIVETKSGTFSNVGGVQDKRLFVVESEMARTLKVMKREGNTLSAVLRDAWDNGDLSSLTKGHALRATDAHISIVAHITQAELGTTLQHAETYNGFANRFLWVLVKRSKLLPDGGEAKELDALRQQLKETIKKASTIERLERSPACSIRWREVYPSLVSPRHGLWDAVTSRAEAQVLRLSMLYALLDCSAAIDTQHLEAALALWRYCDDSTRLIFANTDESNGGTLEQKIKKIVYNKPGIKRTEIRLALSHTIKTATFNSALLWLVDRGEIVCVPVFDKRQADAYYPAVPKSKPPIESETITETPDEPYIEWFPKTSPPSKVELEKSFVEAIQAVDQHDVASLAELLEWRNASGSSFIRRADGSTWVTNEVGLSPRLTEAIKRNADTLAVFIAKQKPTPTTPKGYSKNPPDEMSHEEFARSICEGVGANWETIKNCSKLPLNTMPLTLETQR